MRRTLVGRDTSDDAWRDDFVLRLRLRGVRGVAIGDAMAEVQAHCRESGERPRDAFGEPWEYADRMVEAYRAGGADVFGEDGLGWWRVGLVGVASAAGTALVLEGADHLAHGGPVVVSAGACGAALVVGTVLAGWTAALGGRGGRRPMLLTSLVFALAVSATGLLSLWDRPVLRLPAAVAALLGAALLVAVGLVISGLSRGRRAGARDPRSDPVVDPRTGREPYPVPRWARLAVWSPALLLALALLVVVVLPS